MEQLVTRIAMALKPPFDYARSTAVWNKQTTSQNLDNFLKIPFADPSSQ